MDSALHDAWQTNDGDLDDGGEANDLIVRAVHVALGLYLMPVAALVLVIGGAAVLAGSISQRITGRTATPPAIRLRPTPHLAHPWPGMIRAGR